MHGASEHFIDLSLSHDYLTPQEQAQHQLSLIIGSWAGGKVFARATDQQVADNKARDPLGHERLYQNILSQIANEEAATTSQHDSSAA